MLGRKSVVNLGVLLLTTSAVAKEQAVVDAPASTVEVIEVRAQKRSQNITDVAMAISYLDQETVEKHYLKDSTQLSALVPNLTITHNAGEGTPPAFSLRGIGMIDYNTSTVSPITIYADGVASGSANNLAVNLFDVDSIEVLRGPQGTLFGRNTTGGAILIHAKKPEHEFSGYVKGGLASQDHKSFTSAINMPVTNNTAVRVAVNHQDYSFSTNNLMPGQSDGGLKQTNIRISTLTELDGLAIYGKYYQGQWSGTSKPIKSLGTHRINGDKCAPAEMKSRYCLDSSELLTASGQYNGGDDYWDVIADNGDRRHDSDSWGADLTLTWQVNEQLELRSISAYKNLDRYHGWDSDGPKNLIEGSMDTDNSLVSQELMAAVQFKQIYWLTGLFYLKEQIDQLNDIDLLRDYRGILPQGPGQFFYDNSLENQSVALYSQFDYSLTDKTILTVGGRYTDESTKFRVKADVSVHGVPDLVPMWDSTLAAWAGPNKVEDNEFSGKLALSHSFTDKTKLYASMSRSHKSGGYNAGYAMQKQEAEDSVYRPEKLNAYEVGSKMQLFEQQLRLNVAAFYYDYKDQQIFINQTGIVNHLLKNAGDSTIYGLETELFYQPTQQLVVNLNVGYLPKANIGKYNNGDTSVDDNRLPMTPKVNASGYLLYEMPFFNGSLVSQLSFDYQADFYFDQHENPYTEQQAFTLVNGRITYKANEQLQVSLWGKNLTNTEHSDLLFDTAALGAVTELKAEGRQLGVELGYQF